MKDLSHCQRSAGAGGISLHVLLLSSYLMPVPSIDPTQPEPGVKEASDSVHGESPPRSQSRAEKSRE